MRRARLKEVVRKIMATLYSNAPVDEPGNDDLGAISSWYVWAAIGLYPVTPGTANLALASPLFPSVVLTLPDGRRIVMHAPAASAATPYVHSLKVSGVATPAKAIDSCAANATHYAKGWNQPWLPSSIITSGATLTFDLSAAPDPAWGSDPALSPPSFGSGRLPVVGYSSPSGGVTLPAGSSTTVQLGVQPAQTGTETVRWSASGGALTASPNSGDFTVVAAPRSTGPGSSPGCTLSTPATQTLTIGATTPGSYVLDVHFQTTAASALPPVVIDVDVTG